LLHFLSLQFIVALKFTVAPAVHKTFSPSGVG